MIKNEIIELCKKIIQDYEGWSYSAGKFKNNELKHTIKSMDPSWSFNQDNVLMQASTKVLNKKILALSKSILKRPSLFTSFIIHSKYVSNYDVRGMRIYKEQFDSGKAEEKIRFEMDTCIQILEKYYSYAIEENDFLEKLPQNFEGPSGIEYCLVRAYLQDFDFVLDYRADKIETIRPKRYADVDKIIEYFGIG